MKRSVKHLIAAVSVLVSLAGGAGAATYSWDRTTNNWHTAHWTNESGGGALFSPSYVPGDIYDVTGGVVTVSSTVFSGASLRVSAPAGILSVAVNNGTVTGTLVLAGGLVSNAVSATYTLIPSNGTVVTGGTTNSLLVPTSGQKLTLRSAISGNGVLNKIGPGDVGIETYSPSFTGTLNINGGRLNIDAISKSTNMINTFVSINAGGTIFGYTMDFTNLTLNGGTFDSVMDTDAKVLSGGMAVTADSFVSDTVRPLQLNNTVSGGGKLIVTGAGGIRIMSGYDGGTYSGAVQFAADSSLSLYQTNATIGGLVSSGGTGVVCSSSIVDGTRTLTLQPPAGVTNDFSGVMRNSSTSARLLALVMNGPGGQKLSGICTNTGSTTVNGGALIVNGFMSNAVNGVTVNGPGLFGGTGTIIRTVAVNAGATLSPGDGSVMGALTVSNLTLNAACTNVFHLQATNSSDKVIVNGNLTLGGTFDFVMIPPESRGGEYVLFTYTGTVATNGTPVLRCPSGYNLVSGLTAGSGIVTVGIVKRSDGTIFFIH